MGMLIHNRHRENPIPEEEVKAEVVETKVEATLPTPPKEEEVRNYTRSEIMLMKSADLQKLANDEGIENAYETSGNKLKSILIKHFGL
jgi:hypothetical protein